jgi:GH24 family phage-related lysozyme (muramidase)
MASKPIVQLPDLPDDWYQTATDRPVSSPPSGTGGGILDAVPAPREWTIADSGLNFLFPEIVDAIDFSGTAPPEPPPWSSETGPGVASQLDSRPGDEGFYNGLTPYQPDASLSGARSVSDEGMDFIKRYELSPKTHRVDLNIFPDPQKNPTFGYGHLLDAAAGSQAAFQHQLDGMTDDQKQALADRYFADDVRQARANVFNRLGGEGVARLNQPQYDALVADSFNAGRAPALGPNMVRDIRNGDLSAAGQEFNAYWAKNAQTGEWELPRGLVGRSLQQSQLFNNGDYNYVPLRADVDAIIGNPGPKPRR